MIRIACVGITVMDRIYYVNELPAEGGKYVAEKYHEVGGGPAATAAVAAAKLGAEVDFIGRVGDDDTGNRLLAELGSLGVNTRYVRRIEQARSSQSAILVDQQGERIIINYPSPDLPVSATWMQAIDFSQWDVVLAAGTMARSRRLHWRVRPVCSPCWMAMSRRRTSLNWLH